MAVLFDPSDEFVRSVLDVAMVHGEISLPDLEAICEAGIDARASISMDDILDTFANMGIEIDNGLTQEQEEHQDAEFLRRMREFERQGGTAQLTGHGWLRLLQAIENEKAAESAPRDPTVCRHRGALESPESLCRKRTFADSAPRCISLCEISGLVAWRTT